MRENRLTDDVQESLKTFVREASADDTVSLYTFDRAVGRPTLMTARDRNDLFDVINNLQFTGDRTHLGAAIAKGLDRADELRERSDDSRARAIVLFTDGKEDVRGIKDPITIPSNLERALAGGSHIFFVSMHEHEPKLREFRAGRFIEATSDTEIREVAQRIRKELPEPKPPEPLLVTITPSQLDFGQLDPDSETPERELTITANKAVNVSLSLAETPGIIMPSQNNIPLPAKVKVKLAIADDAAPGARQLAIHVTGAREPVVATITIAQPSLLRRIAPWLALLLAAIVAAIFLLVRHKQQHQLEGEIEIVKPRVGDAAFVGLPTLKATEVALSSIVPPDALNGADARLYCRRKDGDKKVCIAATSGSLRVNSIEVPTTELYDADTIQIGDATLRFNRVGHERPQEDL